MSEEEKQTETRSLQLDGWLLVITAMIPILITGLASDEARKFASFVAEKILGAPDMGPSLLWATGLVLSALSAGLHAFKGWRSTQFADYKRGINGGDLPPPAPGATAFYTAMGAGTAQQPQQPRIP